MRAHAHTIAVAGLTLLTACYADINVNVDARPIASSDGPPPDTGEPPGGDCNLWDPDPTCNEGEKCTAVANDGHGAWNSWQCVPLDPDPRGVGEPCRVLGQPASGLDDCEEGSICWGADPVTGIGTCVGFCQGHPMMPHCPTEDACITFNGGILPLCLSYCDPIAQDCLSHEGCYPMEGGFLCAPDASGPDAGHEYGPCEYINVCEPGLFCAPSFVVPDCEGTTGCCTRYCHIEEPETCDDGTGRECVSFFEVGHAPADLWWVGGCILPP